MANSNITDGDLFNCWQDCKTADKKISFLHRYSKAVSNSPSETGALISPQFTRKLLNDYSASDGSYKLGVAFRLVGTVITAELIESAGGRVVKLDSYAARVDPKPLTPATLTPDGTRMALKTYAK